MKLIKETLVNSNRLIVDADVSAHMMVILHKGKGENIVTINGSDAFTVSAHSSMIRIVDNGIAIYDSPTLNFYTLDGSCKQQVTIGAHLFDLIPMKKAVICTYRDEGVYGHSMGEKRIIVVQEDGKVTSHLSFANEHQLDFDICFAMVKPYACLSSNNNTIVQFTADFQIQKTILCPFSLGDIIAMGYQYPYYLLIEEDKLLCLHENGTYKRSKASFSNNVRSNYHRGPYVFLEIFEQEIIGYRITEDDVIIS